MTTLLDLLGFQGLPAWSPDGTRIAFSSTHASASDIWVLVLSPVSREPTTWGRLKADHRQGHRQR